MPLDNEATWALLRELDNPEHLEFPQDFDHATARSRSEDMVGSLDRQFRCRCEVDRHVEDASHHGTITIPAPATASSEEVTLTVSNFGNLVAVSLGNPGAYLAGFYSPDNPPTWWIRFFDYL